MAATAGILRLPYFLACARWAGLRPPRDVLQTVREMAKSAGVEEQHAEILAALALETLPGRARCPKCKHPGNRDCVYCAGHGWLTDSGRTLARILGVSEATWRRRGSAAYASLRRALEEESDGAARTLGERLR